MKQQGFTLIEVMVALAVVAIALSALSQAAGQFVWNQTSLEQRILGNWVAENEIVKLHTGLLKQPRPSAVEKMMGHDWRLSTTTEPTPVPGVVKLTVAVTPAESDAKSPPVASLVTVWGK